MANTISNSDDIIDSRDVIARIDELREEREALQERFDEAKESQSPAAIEQTEDELATWDAENAEELKALESLADEASGYAADWQYGEALIRDSYFKTYAQELAEDIGAINRDATWPNNCIDWDQATRELQMDYTSVSFDGVDYWIR
jgi:hypothetical protein